jgi:hypothetical protein
MVVVALPAVKHPEERHEPPSPGDMKAEDGTTYHFVLNNTAPLSSIRL